MSKQVNIIVKAIDDKKGEDIRIIDLRNINPLTDYFVICHANNIKMINAIVDNVIQKCEEADYSIRAIEGEEDSGWILIDAYDVIIHVFLQSQRYFYNLEKLWGDMPEVELNEIL
ncbi:MAG: ribosome silencing factor [Erysipelotrichaceae bacterium]|jgi:ribosome-associated protein|nr:ribosome silencing factor [Erysipelotrichaceae bacterium]MDD3924559.1 ribosome silencing factor [Erysipelotrichaceae bacterium]MDD4642167.1 ribosome silencing factor [Erysipelotrichaceae bacterium]